MRLYYRRGEIFFEVDNLKMDIIHLLFSTWYGGLFLMIICSVIIAKACDSFEVATDYLGRKMSAGVKGATLNAIGSSMPELLTTVFFLVFAAQENLGRDLAASIGGNTGSAIFNSIVIPMLVIIAVLFSAGGPKSLKIDKKVVLRDGIFLIVAEILLLFLLADDFITHWHGWAFSAFYFVYLGYLFWNMKRVQRVNGVKETEHTLDEDTECRYQKYLLKREDKRRGRAWWILFLSTAVIAIACAGLVEGCKAISDSLAINPIFIALILVAAASSVPDTIISIKDAKKGNYEDAMANVMGSNIFDITISMGLPLGMFLLLTNQEIDFREAGSSLMDIRVILVLVTAITIAVFYFPKALKRRHAIVLGVLYIAFILYAIGSASYNAGGDDFLAREVGAIARFLNSLML